MLTRGPRARLAFQGRRDCCRRAGPPRLHVVAGERRVGDEPGSVCRILERRCCSGKCHGFFSAVTFLLMAPPSGLCGPGSVFRNRQQKKKKNTRWETSGFQVQPSETSRSDPPLNTGTAGRNEASLPPPSLDLNPQPLLLPFWPTLQRTQRGSLLTLYK